MAEVANYTDYTNCIEACNQCAIDCLACVSHQLGEQTGNDCPRCCLECATLCQLCVQAMSMDYRFVQEYCRLCAEVCNYCARQCEEHPTDHCQACAESCRRCAEMCQTVAG